MFSKRSAVSTRRVAARIVVAGAVATACLPASATAQPIVDVTSSLAGDTVAVGDTAQGRLTVANHSTSPHDLGYLTLSELTLIPTCSTYFVDVSCMLAPGADLGVVSIGTAGSGTNACNGTPFAISLTDAQTDKRTFAPGAPVQLSVQGATSTCVVSFPYTVARMPQTDANAELDGIQTNLLAFVKATGGPGVTTAKADWREITVERDTPELFARASQPVAVGGPLSVAGTLTGTHPAGTMTFKLFGPADPGCGGSPMYTHTIGVSGNGTYQAPAVTAQQAGTHRWQIAYTGDADNKAATSDCNAASTLVTSTPATGPPPPPPVGPAPSGGGTTPGGGTSPGAGSTPGGGGVPGAVVRRIRLDRFALTRRSFARASAATALAATAAKATSSKKKQAKRAAKGTTIKYTISAPATVTIRVERATKGRKSGSKCVKATKRNTKRKACTLYVKASTLKRTHKAAGAKKVPFSGRAGRKALRSGTYRMRATAAAGPGTTSPTRTASFKIVRR